MTLGTCVACLPQTHQGFEMVKAMTLVHCVFFVPANIHVNSYEFKSLGFILSHSTQNKFCKFCKFPPPTLLRSNL